MQELVGRYEEAFAVCKDPTAAAILVLAHQISALEHHAAKATESLEGFDHQICMGIRKGLFGAAAEENASIKD